MRDRDKTIISLILLISLILIVFMMGEIHHTESSFKTLDCYNTYESLGYTTCDYPEPNLPD